MSWKIPGENNKRIIVQQLKLCVVIVFILWKGWFITMEYHSCLWKYDNTYILKNWQPENNFFPKKNGLVAHII